MQFKIYKYRNKLATFSNSDFTDSVISLTESNLFRFAVIVATFGLPTVIDHAALRHSVRLLLNNPPDVIALRKNCFAYYFSAYLWGSVRDTL